MFKHTFGIAISIIGLVLVVGCGPVDIVTSVPALPTGTTESILPTMTAEPDLPTATSESVLPTATTEPAPTLAVPRFEEAACAFEIPEGFQPECGYLIVPPLIFGFDPAELTQTLSDRGLKLISDGGATEFQKDYLKPLGRQMAVIDMERVAFAEVMNPLIP